MRAHPTFYPKATSKKSYLIKLRKKVLNKVSTKKELCWNSQYETCHDIYDCKMIAEKYNCSISYLYSGAHMDHECYAKCEQFFFTRFDFLMIFTVFILFFLHFLCEYKFSGELWLKDTRIRIFVKATPGDFEMQDIKPF